MRPNRSAFTLLTVLQAIAIILVLRPFFVETYGIARVASRERCSFCAAKEVGTSWLMYAADSNETTPIAKPYSRADQVWGRVWQTWCGTIEPTGGHRLFSEDQGLVASYFKRGRFDSELTDWSDGFKPKPVGLSCSLFENCDNSPTNLGVVSMKLISNLPGTILLGSPVLRDWTKFNGYGPLAVMASNSIIHPAKLVAELFYCDGHMTALNDFPIATCENDPSGLNDAQLMTAERAYQLCRIWAPMP